MTDDKTYVALKPMRFGANDLAPGDPVPYDPHRNYAQMLRLGQIAVVGEAGQGTPAPTTGATLRLDETSVLVFVAEDGRPELATFSGVEFADEVTAEGLGVALGERVAAVVFMEGQHPSYVRFDSLLPGLAATRLLAFEQARVAAASELGVQSSASARQAGEIQAQALRGDVAFLELLLKAVRTLGEPLPPDFPALKELQGNGLDTLEGVQLLASGEQGRANLIRLDAIGGGRADKILTRLASPGQDPPPVGDAPPPTGDQAQAGGADPPADVAPASDPPTPGA